LTALAIDDDEIDLRMIDLNDLECALNSVLRWNWAKLVAGSLRTLPRPRECAFRPMMITVSGAT
jgi:hypothetical protein